MVPVVKPIVPDMFLKNLDVIPAKVGIYIKKSLKLKIFYYIVFFKSFTLLDSRLRENDMERKMSGTIGHKPRGGHSRFYRSTQQCLARCGATWQSRK